LNSAAILLSISFAILFGAVPFQAWLSNVASDGSPPVVTFIFTVHLGTVWFMLLAYLQTYAWLGRQASFGTLFTALGLLMMVGGGLLAASQRRLGRLLGYATLVDNGAMLVALGTEQAEGVALAVMLLLARPLALGLMTLGLQGLRDFGEGDDSRESVMGAAWRTPWRAVAFLMGGVALAGFPISLGFSARWGLYSLVAKRNLPLGMLALAGNAGVMMGLVGAIRALLTPTGENGASRITIVEDPGVLVLIILLLVTTLGLGFFPQGVSELALQMANWYTFFQ
jgi:NADH:ubiquinone oxidoreductase subunit 2 (subunit N)